VARWAGERSKQRKGTFGKQRSAKIAGFLTIIFFFGAGAYAAGPAGAFSFASAGDPRNRRRARAQAPRFRADPKPFPAGGKCAWRGDGGEP